MAGIYLHIPFCKTRCIYCDFYSTTQINWKDRYVKALCMELEIRRTYLKGAPIETIYFGGGTPSQLEKKDFEEIFSCIDKHYGLSHCREITLEANPDDLTDSYLQMLSSLPINRLSMGIQTFHDPTLQLLKRRHSASQAIEAVHRSRDAGFTNISIDLIYGLPYETRERWEYDLQQAISLHPEHLSAYHLTYEEGTPIFRMLQQHQVEEVDEDCSLYFYTTLVNRLKAAGYEHYEISNFCLPGKYAQHNSSYWKGIPYLGCGASAHSFDGNAREWNISSLQEYTEGIENGTLTTEKEERDAITSYNELIITSIRTRWGINLKALEQTHGTSLYNHCLRMASDYLASHKLIIDRGNLRLTEEGVFISDSIMRDLIYIEEDS